MKMQRMKIYYTGKEDDMAKCLIEHILLHACSAFSRETPCGHDCGSSLHIVSVKFEDLPCCFLYDLSTSPCLPVCAIHNLKGETQMPNGQSWASRF